MLVALIILGKARGKSPEARDQKLLGKLLGSTSTVNCLREMPKQNRVKNLFRGSSSQAQSQALSPSFGRVSLHPPQSTQPIQSSSFVGGSLSSVGGSSQHVSPSSSSEGISSQPQPTKRRKVREEVVHGDNWHVQLIDEDEEVIKKC
ncbi:hypothetical protein K7X08_023020 [Anisodus acutangulus]|uniref:Uncharacterized protein n=1 Tax=Anisodus acutangulus TaxID=402998 RepID=A0A9Q1MBV7_9SOLA|nr:hypothetical protein K7X08_023020 [Anisodus acutangulus]